jgi:hypothetical protein
MSRCAHSGQIKVSDDVVTRSELLGFGPNRVGVSHPSREGGNRYTFRNVVFSIFQNIGRRTKSDS